MCCCNTYKNVDCGSKHSKILLCRLEPMRKLLFSWFASPPDQSPVCNKGLGYNQHSQQLCSWRCSLSRLHQLCCASHGREQFIGAHLKAAISKAYSCSIDLLSHEFDLYWGDRSCWDQWRAVTQRCPPSSKATTHTQEYHATASKLLTLLFQGRRQIQDQSKKIIPRSEPGSQAVERTLEKVREMFFCRRLDAKRRLEISSPAELPRGVSTKATKKGGMPDALEKTARASTRGSEKIAQTAMPTSRRPMETQASWVVDSWGPSLAAASLSSSLSSNSSGAGSLHAQVE